MAPASSRIRFEDVVNGDDDFIHEQNHEDEKTEFRNWIWNNRAAVQLLVFLHLKLGSGDGYTVFIPPTREWEEGRFNVSFPVQVVHLETKKAQTVMFRVPIPDALGETDRPGSVEEKIRVEAGNHIWVTENCPSVPIAHMYGFGFADDRHFTHIDQSEPSTQLGQHFQRIMATAFAQKKLAPYIRNGSFRSPFAYIVSQYISPKHGSILTDRIEDGYTTERCVNLFTGIAAIMLTLASVPQDRIGSYHFNDDGTVTLTARPMFSAFTMLETAGVRRTIDKGRTYSNSEAFMADLVAFQQNRLLDLRNAVKDEKDAKAKMGALSILRAIAHRFVRRASRNGPFLMMLTELDMNHLIVDGVWNVKYLIDLEFLCSLPAEMWQEPHWLTSRLVDADASADEAEAEADAELVFTVHELRLNFLRILLPMETVMRIMMRHDLPLYLIIQEQWRTEGAWFWESLISLNGSGDFVRENTSYVTFPPGGPRLLDVVCQFWGEDAEDVIARKVEDRARYVERLRDWFRARDAIIARTSRLTAVPPAPAFEPVRVEETDVEPMDLDEPAEDTNK